MPAGPVCFVFRRKRRRDGVLHVAETYTACIALPGEPRQHLPTGLADKRAAEAWARERLLELERERAGIGLPRRVVDEASRSLTAHFDDFHDELIARGASTEYAYIQRRLLLRLSAEVPWSRLADLSVERFESWRRKHCTEHSARNLNQYLAAASGFARWLVRRGIWPDNPLRNVVRVAEEGKQRRRRRALSVDEQQRLLSVAGPRLPAYALILETGLRRSEAEALRWGDLEFRDGGALLRLDGSATKNGRDVVRPLRDSTARVLLAIRPRGFQPGQRVFARGLPDVAALKADLEAAGIPFEDHRGARVDLHALRHTAITNLGAAGVAPRLVQEFARHSDMRLTNRVYTDVQRLGMDSVLSAMPSYAAVERAASEGVPVEPRGTAEWTPERMPERDAKGRFVTGKAEPPPFDDSSESLSNKHLRRDAAGAVADGRRLAESSLSTTSSNRFSPIIVEIWPEKAGIRATTGCQSTIRRSQSD